MAQDRGAGPFSLASAWGNVLRVSQETNLQNKGLISEDRSNKATLLLTIPRSLFKSSAKDLSPPIFEIVIRVTHLTSGRLLYDLGLAPIFIRVTLVEVEIVAF